MEFRDLRRDDFPLVVRWLEAPHVAASEWGAMEASSAEVESEYGAGVDGRRPGAAFLVYEEERPIGLIQCCRLGDEPHHMGELSMIDPPSAAVGIDYLIGEADRVGRGAGTEMIRQFTARLWESFPDAPSVVVRVLADNPASWRALEKAGFARVWSGEAPSDYGTDEPAYIYELPRPPPAP